tara:strand:- start:48345 stop:48527 length:183 start_codon:yes stop_codon:yes gene_type:complete
MGVDESFESFVQLRNTSKPNKWVCLKYKFIRLAYLARYSLRFVISLWSVGKATVLIAQET